MAAGKLIGDSKQRPARTIRVVAFANEEQGLHGGKAYAAQARRRRAQAPDRAPRAISVPAASMPSAAARRSTRRPRCSRSPRCWRRSASRTRPARAARARTSARSPAMGMAWASLRQDGTDYFDYHHTPDDTLDKIDPKALAQNVAAYAVFAYLAASRGRFRQRAASRPRRRREVIGRYVSPRCDDLVVSRQTAGAAHFTNAASATDSTDGLARDCKRAASTACGSQRWETRRTLPVEDPQKVPMRSRLWKHPPNPHAGKLPPVHNHRNDTA